MKLWIGKRFIFATVSMVSVTIATVVLKFDGETYFKLVSAIVGSFMLTQTVTDYKNKII